MLEADPRKGCWLLMAYGGNSSLAKEEEVEVGGKIKDEDTWCGSSSGSGCHLCVDEPDDSFVLQHLRDPQTPCVSGNSQGSLAKCSVFS
jgi:hypothetical protein